MSNPNFSNNNWGNDDWRISDAQRAMIYDKVVHLSKKEAGLLISFMESCIFGRRMNQEKKNE